MMKLVFTELSVVQSVFLRGLFVCPMLILICLQRHQLFAAVPRSDRGIIACRTAMEITITFLFLLALSQLSLAHVTAVLQAVPLILTAFGAIILREKVGWRRWMAVITGFIGVMFIIKPGLDSFSVFSLSVLMAAILIAARDILTRQLSVQTPSFLVALVTALALQLQAAWPLLLLVGRHHHYQLVLNGRRSAGNTCGICAEHCHNACWRCQLCHPFRYTAVVFATILSCLLTGHLPDGLSFLGTILVIVAGIYAYIANIFWLQNKKAMSSAYADSRVIAAKARRR